MSMSTCKKRLLGALWFGVSGYIAAALSTGISIYLQDKSLILALLNPYTIATALIALFLGGVYGNKVIDCARENNLLKAIKYGFLGGAVFLLIIDAGLIFLIVYVASSFKEFWNVTLLVISTSLTAGGWAVMPVGIISALLLFKISKKFFV